MYQTNYRIVSLIIPTRYWSRRLLTKLRIAGPFRNDMVERKEEYLAQINCFSAGRWSLHRTKLLRSSLKETSKAKSNRVGTFLNMTPPAITMIQILYFRTTKGKKSTKRKRFPRRHSSTKQIWDSLVIQADHVIEASSFFTQHMMKQRTARARQ